MDCEAEPGSTSGADEGGWDGEQPQPQAFGFPAAGLGVGQGEELAPGGQVQGELDQGAPQLVLGEAVQGQIREAGVFGDPDPVLGARAAPVPQLQLGQLAADGVGREGGDPVPIDLTSTVRA